jgi:hypothetical protein
MPTPNKPNTPSKPNMPTKSATKPAAKPAAAQAAKVAGKVANGSLAVAKVPVKVAGAVVKEVGSRALRAGAVVTGVDKVIDKKGPGFFSGGLMS